MSHTNTSALLNPFGIIKTGKLEWVSIILACLIVLNLNSTIKPVKAVTESESKWVLVEVNVGEGAEMNVEQLPLMFREKPIILAGTSKKKRQ